MVREGRGQEIRSQGKARIARVQHDGAGKPVPFLLTRKHVYLFTCLQATVSDMFDAELSTLSTLSTWKKRGQAALLFCSFISKEPPGMQRTALVLHKVLEWKKKGVVQDGRSSSCRRAVPGEG